MPRLPPSLQLLSKGSADDDRDTRDVRTTRPRSPGEIGGETFALIAGPCAVESREQLLETAIAVRDAGGTLLRGGAYKPRTSPYAFQGLGEEGLALLAEAKAETGLPVITEVMDPRELESVLEVADVLQIGSRNMQNYPPADRGRPFRRAGTAQARPVEHDRRAAVLGRVHPQGGQRVGDAVRARDPDVRDRLPVHARPGGGARRSRSAPTCR